MKQHPIPHNILDIEFKLFGKLTLKQAGFIAIGGVSGGLFLILRANGVVPDILAWPAFLLLSGVGLFLGLVPINEQTADKIIGYYFTAIGKPTRRVWKNEQFKQRLDVIAEEKGLLLTQGNMDRNNLQQNSNPSTDYIGSGPSVPATQQFATQSTIDELDSEELEKIKRFEALAAETDDTPIKTQPQQIEEAQLEVAPVQKSVPQVQPIQSDTDNLQQTQQPSSLTLSTEDKPNNPPVAQTEPRLQTQVIQDQTQDNQQAIPQQQPAQVQPVPAQQTKPQQPISPATVTPTIQKPNKPNPVVQHVPQQVEQNYVISSETNANLPPSQIQVTSQPNIPYLQLLDTTRHPIPQTLVIIKNTAGIAVQAHQTNSDGAIIPTRPLENGTYVVEVQSNKYNFPSIQYIADGKAITPIQIKAK
jgi:hypothetical protein